MARVSLGFWVMWLATAITFPIGGGIASIVAGSVDGVARGLIGGAIAGAVIGTGQWLVLRQFIPLSAWWIVTTSLGLASALALAVGVLGTKTDPLPLAMRESWRVWASEYFSGWSSGSRALWSLLRCPAPGSCCY